MPLIIVTGYPCSGKTYRATQILSDLQSRFSSQNSDPNLTATYVPSHHASLDPPASPTSRYAVPEQKSNPRDLIYNSSLHEKTARAEEFSAVKRALSKNNVVIADGLNYIKGFRYQLWCEAKAAGTRCIVVHAAAREDEASKWNDERLKERGWGAGDKQENNETYKVTGPKIGRDVKGDLMPESHTALYGDKIVDYNGGTRSRSSSMGGGLSDEEGDTGSDSRAQRNSPRPKDDTMTLKSLYISDHPDSTSSTTIQLPPSQPNPTSTSTPTTTAPSIPPPPPTSSLPYTPSTLSSLIMRYEPPSPFTRWDTPLFTIPSTDPHPDYSQIYLALFPPPLKPTSKKALSQLPRNPPPSTNPQPNSQVKPHASTTLPKPTSSSALQTLESATLDATKSILSAARAQNISNGEGGILSFSVALTTTTTTTAGGEIELTLTLPPNMVLSQPMLQRLRRKYTQLQRGGIAHGVGYVSGREEVVRGFVGFLEAEFEG